MYLNSHANESWVLLLVKALAKYLGSYDALCEPSCTFERLCSVLLGSQPTKLSTKEFRRIYERRFPQYGPKFKYVHEGGAGNSDRLLETYCDVQMASKSQRFIIYAQKKSKPDANRGRESVNMKMAKAVDRVFFKDYSYRLTQVAKDDITDSTFEVVSKLTPDTKAPPGVLFPTIDQFSYFFNEIKIVQNPLSTHKTMYQTIFTPIIGKHFYVFLLQFEVSFSDTLVQLNIALQGKEKEAKIEAMPVQYFLARQYKHAFMYVGGHGQENSATISKTHALPVGMY